MNNEYNIMGNGILIHRRITLRLFPVNVRLIQILFCLLRKEILIQDIIISVNMYTHCRCELTMHLHALFSVNLSEA